MSFGDFDLGWNALLLLSRPEIGNNQPESNKSCSLIYLDFLPLHLSGDMLKPSGAALTTSKAR